MFLCLRHKTSNAIYLQIILYSYCIFSYFIKIHHHLGMHVITDSRQGTKVIQSILNNFLTAAGKADQNCKHNFTCQRTIKKKTVEGSVCAKLTYIRKEYFFFKFSHLKWPVNHLCSQQTPLQQYSLCCCFRINFSILPVLTEKEI